LTCIEEHQNIGKGLWKKMWKRLRIYAGLWKHPDFYDQIDVKDSKEKVPENKKKDELYRHKMAKYEVKSRARPFLKVKLREPEYVEEDEKRLGEKRQKEKESILQINEKVCFVSDVEKQNEGLREDGTKEAFLTDLSKTITPFKGQRGALIVGATSNISSNHFLGSPLRFDNISTNKTCKV